MLASGVGGKQPRCGHADIEVGEAPEHSLFVVRDVRFASHPGRIDMASEHDRLVGVQGQAMNRR